MADEVNEQMAQPIGPQMDEDELNKELEEMESELMDSQLLAAPTVPSTIKSQANSGDRGRCAHVLQPPLALHSRLTHFGRGVALVCCSLLSAPTSTAIAPPPAVEAASSSSSSAAPQRQVVMSGDAAGASSAAAASSSGAAASGGANKKLSAKEQNELKELEALMGM